MGSTTRDYRKLTTLWVNVVRWDTNDQWRKALTDFVADDIREEYAEYIPEDYVWAEFEDFAEGRLGYDPLKHTVVFAQFGVESTVAKPREVLDEATWEDILYDIADGKVVVTDNTDLYFLVMPRKNPKQPIPSMTRRIAESEQSNTAEEAWVTDAEETDGQPTARPSIDPDQDRLQHVKLENESDDEVYKRMMNDPDDPSTHLIWDVHSGASINTPSSDSESSYSEGGRNAVFTPASSKTGGSPAIGPSTSTPARGTPTRGRAATRGRLATRGAPSTRGQLTSRPRTARGTHQPEASSRGMARASTITRRGAIRRRNTGPKPTEALGALPKSGVATPSALPSPQVNTIPASTYLTLLEDLTAEYHTSSTADADYGALDPHAAVDTFIGSQNTGNTDAAWKACLEFFNVNLVEYQKREALAANNKAAEARKRVPMKRLPGTTVGLFDYQLMGVFNLLRFTLHDVSGGLLCDEQGLGKTQEMYGVVAFAHALRRCKADVKAAWRKGNNQKTKGNPSQHHPQGAVVGNARACPFDERYGFRCYCYCPLTRELADRLPEGPNVVVAPARSCASMVRDAKLKLDTKVFKIRGFHEGGDKEDKLTAADVGALRAAITATQGGAGPVYQYQAGAGQSDYIIVVSPEFIPRLNNQFGVEVKVANAADKVKKSALVPGMVLMDEFHEYAIAKEGEDSRTVAWLQHLKKCCLKSEQPTPLAYFVSGTPLGETLADLRSAVSLLEKEAWQEESHPLSGATVAAFDDLVSTFDRLTEIQASGEVVATPGIIDYRRRLDRVLKHTMVRRLGTDQFQGRNLTGLGPLKVNITDHKLPSQLTDSLQSLANHTRDLATAAAAEQGIPLARLLRSKTGEALLLKLRLASTFPGIAAASDSFTFTPSEIHTHLTAARGDVTKTPYYAHIPAWSAASPKLETLSQTITTMLADKTPIPGCPCPAKKYCIFTPLEAESLLIQSYLLLKRAHPQFRGWLKPVLLHSSMPQQDRQRVLDQFLTEGNAPPNVLVAPLALAGTGLNLQRARYSTVTGPAWTKRENQQAYYRIHRVGQRMETRLGLLTGRWNPAERIVLGGYEGKAVVEDGGGEGVWEVGNRFCEEGGEDGLVERHQGVEGR
ncbi:hypothetical protein C8A01DRAFT_17334 [Parachaetomium inaequale]|uniref:Helicase C-terminal domain-containing protein n=1 Tax=Parachaetomium inaequale TaxID=2588326 RepID=A0AAN6PGL3_9PEZI|nr:hypothetical protein C8A01DRAFT_17334 [Parachaetomium inaequale]